jgi:hypothetical protein
MHFFSANSNLIRMGNILPQRCVVNLIATFGCKSASVLMHVVTAKPKVEFLGQKNAETRS